MTPEQYAARGEQARRILEDPLFIESFEAVKRNILRNWTETKVGESAEREQFYLQLALLEKLKLSLTCHMQNGTTAIFRIEQDKRRKNAK